MTAPSEELGKPERPPAMYAKAYHRSIEDFAKVDKARYEVALRGVSSAWRVFSSCFVTGDDFSRT